MPKTAVDPFFVTSGPDSAPRKAAAVTPSNTQDLSNVTKMIFVGGAGNLAIIMADDADASPVTINAVPAGTMLELQVRRVMAANTTATNILALW
ncbi:hypothetical protein AAFX91_00250 [Bradyrhizobium sp. 31Argb]|uniref:spike base protein, RCAP_Rcc01079 family n=1 Tax=Bradyrhizobium sp. 31Argb TaxID=3141247 RepID=UPI003747823F